MFSPRLETRNAASFAPGGLGPEVPRRRAAFRLEKPVSLHVPAAPTNTPDPAQVGARTPQMHSCDLVVAPSGLVSRPASSLSAQISPCLRGSFPSRKCLSTRQASEADSLASGLVFSAQVQRVLLNSRKPSTRHSFALKWKKYLDFLSTRSASESSLSLILDFLLNLRNGGLSCSSV